MATALSVEERRALVLAEFQEGINDEAALLRDPEVHTGGLINQVNAAQLQGVISAEDLREHLEWADAAQAWAIEELLNRELN